ncbi:MAG: NUDIX hydrolase [Candidatus Dormibacteria bacterium]
MCRASVPTPGQQLVRWGQPTLAVVVAARGKASPARDAVVGLLVRDRQVLLCHRAAGRTSDPDVWDLPGGHVEAGEDPAEVLVRELAEELGVRIAAPSGPELASRVAPEFRMRVWLVEEWIGEPAAPEEHDAVAWFGASRWPEPRLAHPGYGPIIRDALAPARAPE